MLDADLPLTLPEWPEWGNPIESKDARRRLGHFSPTLMVNDPIRVSWQPLALLIPCHLLGTTMDSPASSDFGRRALSLVYRAKCGAWWSQRTLCRLMISPESTALCFTYLICQKRRRMPFDIDWQSIDDVLRYGRNAT